MTVDARREEQLRIQALGAALSRREWWEVEQAYNRIRDEFDRRPTDARLEAAEAALAKAVEVKALEWHADNAHSIVGRYWITYTGGRIGLHRDQQRIGKFGSPDEAKAAAQADFEARIRSALAARAAMPETENTDGD